MAELACESPTGKEIFEVKHHAKYELICDTTSAKYSSVKLVEYTVPCSP